MKSKMLKYLCLVMVIVLGACKASVDDYTDDWVGEWKTTDKMQFPQSKSTHTGAITKDPDTKNRLIVSGTLLGMNSSYKMPVTLSSSTSGKVDYTTTFKISGTMTLKASDSLQFIYTLTKDNVTVKDTIRAKKL